MTCTEAVVVVTVVVVVEDVYVTSTATEALLALSACC
jgi:hypothetical protein